MVPVKSAQKSPWSQHAKQWSLVGSPLRPCAEDSNLYWNLIGDLIAGLAAPQVLLLGVTPELALLPWPGTSQLTAVDMNQSMIDRVWPASDLSCDGEALCAKWQQLPLASDSVDIVVGDGPINVLPDSSEYKTVIDELHRALRANGRLVLRFFASPDGQENMEQVRAALDTGRIGSMHALKWRIAMALQTSIADGVAVSGIRDCLNDWMPDRQAAADRLDWPVEAINTIDAYKGSTVTYTFPTLTEIEAAISGRFQIDRICYPCYELGERCPVIRFDRIP